MELVLAPSLAGDFVGMAALGGCGLSIAWLMGVAWARGRMRNIAQGSAPRAVMGQAAPRHAEPPEPVGRPAVPAACQQRAIAERRDLLAAPVSLAELAAEVAEIRRDERILRAAENEPALLALPRLDSRPQCRFLGLSGQPTCPAMAGRACRHDDSCGDFAGLAERGSARLDGAQQPGLQAALSSSRPSTRV